jgi:hypothetical protein
MSSLISALKTHTPKNLGEKGHVQYDWSNDINEKIVQFHFQLVRAADHTKLEEQLHIIISTLKAYTFPLSELTATEATEYINKLTMVYKLIGHTRDILKGKGEQQLSFMQILVWYNYFPELAINAFTHLVKIDKEHPYGSWKDVKYFCNFVKDKHSYTSKQALEHPLVIHAMKLLISQLNADWVSYSSNNGESKVNSDKNTISLAARWTPREPNWKKKKNVKFGWIYKSLAMEMFSEFLRFTSPENANYSKAVLKCKIHFSRRISTLNKFLDTTQVKQCGKKWEYINFNNVTTQTLRRQKTAFQNKTKRNIQRSEDEDRINCATNYKNHINAAKLNPQENKVHGKRCSVYELVKDALVITNKSPHTQTDIDTINLQWNDNLKNNKGLEQVPIIPLVDTSGSMECDNCIPLYNAIGLGIRTSELTHPAFRNQVLTFEDQPRWINMDDCETFWDKAQRVKRAAWGTSTKIYKAFRMILDVCIEKNIPREEVENMILAIFSDMQIDISNIEESPFNNLPLAEMIEEMFNMAGYNVPHLLFWNLRLTSGFPMISKQKNITALSGFSSVLLNAFCNKGIDALRNFTPSTMLEDMLNQKRYNIMEEDMISFINQ